VSAVDITALVGRASERRGAWSISVASVVAWVFATAHGLEVDFDGDAGEGWVRLIREGRPVAYLNVHVPLLLSAGTTGTWPYPIVAVVLEDLDTQALRCVPQLLSDAFGSDRLQEHLDPEGFTAEELWYGTV
jgi:hypothetical protein